jgi:outer membrane lipoprotein-sorting protein
MRPTESIKRLIKNAKIKTNPQVNEAVLKDLLDEMDNIEAKRSTVFRPNVWRNMMKSKMIKYAAAAVVLMTVGLWTYYHTGSIDGPNVAWADVQKQLQTFRPHAYKETITYSNSKVDVLTFFYRNLYGRREILEQGEIRIWDFSVTPIVNLVLNPQTRKAIKTIYTDGKPTRDFDLLRTVANIEADNGRTRTLGERVIEGHKAVGFHCPDPINDFTIWVDKMTRLPVQVQLVQRGRTIIMNEFQFPDDFDPSLFSTDPPAGYDVQVIEKQLSEQRPVAKPFNRRYSCTQLYRETNRPEFRMRLLRKDLSRRRQVYGNGREIVFDMSARPVRILELNIIKHEARQQVLENKGPQEDPDIIGIALGLRDGSEKPVPPRTINGKKYQGYKGTLVNGERWSVWTDPNGGLPVLIEADQGNRMLIISDFDYSTPLDDSLFDIKVPAGYKLVK